MAAGDSFPNSFRIKKRKLGANMEIVFIMVNRMHSNQIFHPRVWWNARTKNTKEMVPIMGRMTSTRLIMMAEERTGRLSQIQMIPSLIGLQNSGTLAGTT